MRKVISITNMRGEEIPLPAYRFWFVGKDIAYAYIEGFMKVFSKADGYIVTTMEV